MKKNTKTLIILVPIALIAAFLLLPVLDAAFSDGETAVKEKNTPQVFTENPLANLFSKITQIFKKDSVEGERAEGAQAQGGADATMLAGVPAGDRAARASGRRGSRNAEQGSEGAIYGANANEMTEIANAITSASSAAGPDDYYTDEARPQTVLRDERGNVLAKIPAYDGEGEILSNEGMVFVRQVAPAVGAGGAFTSNPFFNVTAKDIANQRANSAALASATYAAVAQAQTENGGLKSYSQESVRQGERLASAAANARTGGRTTSAIAAAGAQAPGQGRSGFVDGLLNFFSKNMGASSNGKSGSGSSGEYTPPTDSGGPEIDVARIREAMEGVRDAAPELRVDIVEKEAEKNQENLDASLNSDRIKKVRAEANAELKGQLLERMPQPQNTAQDNAPQFNFPNFGGSMGSSPQTSSSAPVKLSREDKQKMRDKSADILARIVFEGYDKSSPEVQKTFKDSIINPEKYGFKPNAFHTDYAFLFSAKNETLPEDMEKAREEMPEEKRKELDELMANDEVYLVPNQETEFPGLTDKLGANKTPNMPQEYILLHGKDYNLVKDAPRIMAEDLKANYEDKGEYRYEVFTNVPQKLFEEDTPAAAINIQASLTAAKESIANPDTGCSNLATEIDQDYTSDVGETCGRGDDVASTKDEYAAIFYEKAGKDHLTTVGAYFSEETARDYARIQQEGRLRQLEEARQKLAEAEAEKKKRGSGRARNRRGN